MTENNTHDRDDERLAQLLRVVDADVPPLDRERLDALAEQSADAFVGRALLPVIPPKRAGEPEGVSPRTESSATADRPGADALRLATKTFINRRTRMLTLAWRGMAALAVSAAIVVVGLLTSQPTPVSGAVPFSEVLAELRGAETLQFRLMKNVRDSAEIWVRAPGLVRKEESPQRYEIAAGSRLWRVDEVANTVSESDSPWFLSANKQIDLVGLLDVGVRDASALLTMRPVSREQIEGRDCFVYFAKLDTPQGVISVEAFAEVESKRLLRLTAWPGTRTAQSQKWNRENAARIKVVPPLADLQLIALNVPVADEKFVVAQSLTEDGRIGKVAEAQGIVVVRPMLAKRWTPVCREMLLKPGDWLRTELRGANAVKVRLSSEVELTLGPGSLIECMSPTKARLHSGQVQVNVAQAARLSRLEGDGAKRDDDADQKAKQKTQASRLSYELLAPRDGSRVFKPNDKQLVRVDRDEKLVDVAQTPLWLAGFEGTSSNESLGSLIVNLPDGRNEPLMVGYHKVSVEIRDQIARTTIEESFVNHTVSRLEGVFHFPLPQEASISGFGMWIGNELVEADVVEKQRAREIYETILRERRDPGLLEWAGGNIFKARVFPIEPHSEKRIKIVYTQVLPLRANQYRYSYGLRSELLRTKPLRELSLSVTVNSALPLKSVKCSTHPVRVTGGWPLLAVAGEKDGQEWPSYNSAKVEFAAQEYTPTRDFEVVCEIDGRQSDVVVVPHRRGNDGYLLVQVLPPLVAGTLRVPNADGTRSVPATTLLREVLPDGQPLNVVLLCDTSASMNSEKRKQQAEFVATVLASLGEADRFQLAAADVGTVWAFAEPVAANAKNVAKAQAFLDERVSLGWTNLDRAFEETLKKAPANAQVIYIGDGIVSSGDTDPAAFVKRLRSRLAPRDEPNASPTPNSPNDSDKVELEKRSARHAERDGYVHAVGVGNSFESVVLKGIAEAGGGSVRNIGGEQTPQIVALELLNEITSPGLRDLNVEFRGLRVAAVYPGRLPNLAAGTQQILVGRYLPDGQDQVGEIIVTGMRGTEKVRYAARVNLKDAEAGNSFIPRLWARAHLDQLLAQGQSPAIRDEIIRLSEEFHIITPFTSLLVLETDADRERFGVQRRYEMRDGERYFAEGRDNANYELLQQQMKRAGDWRLGLRRQVLRELAGLGRNPFEFQQQLQPLWALDGSGASPTIPVSAYYSELLDDDRKESLFAGGGGADGLYRYAGNAGRMMADDGRLGELSTPFDQPLSLRDTSMLFGDADGESALSEFDRSSDEELSLGVRGGDDEQQSLPGLSLDLNVLSDEAPSQVQSSSLSFGVENSTRLSAAAKSKSLRAEKSDGTYFMKGGKLARGGIAKSWNFMSHHAQPDYASWLGTLFPALADPPSKIVPPVKEPVGWSPEAIALSKSLLRVESLLKLDGGIELKRVTDGFDVRWKRRAARSSDLALYSPSGWLTRPTGSLGQTVVEFCDAKERGVFSLAFLLGRVRASFEQELKSPTLGLTDFSLNALHENYVGYSGRVEPAGENRVKLIVTHERSKSAGHFVIDTAKHVVLKHEWFAEEKLTGSTTLSDFVEVAGSWWAKSAKSIDAKGRTVSETTLDVRSLTKDEYQQRLTAELAAKPNVQFLRQPFVRLSVARQKVADGSAGFDERLTMIRHNASLQQWDELWRQVEAIEKASLANKPGLRWLQTMLCATIRRNEEARQRLLVEAKQLAANPRPQDYFLTEFVLGQAYSLMGWPEFLEFVETLKPVFDRQAADADVLPQWQERFLQCLDNSGRHEEGLTLRLAMVKQSPWHLHWQTDYANRLARMGQPDAGIAWLQQELAREIERESYEDETLRSSLCELFRTHARWTDLLKFTADWVARKPESSAYHSAYSQHLSALVFNDQLDAANALVEQWFKEARIDGPLAPDQRARLETAIQFANGSATNLSFQRPDERWFEHLADTIRFFLRHAHHSDIGTRGIGNQYFQQSDIADRLRGEFLGWLSSNTSPTRQRGVAADRGKNPSLARRASNSNDTAIELANLTPTQINALLGWTLSGRIELKEPLNGRKQLDATEVPNEIWRAIATALKPRWVASQDKDEKHLLGESLRSIYSTRFADSELLPFLREHVATAHREHRTSYVLTLFEALLTVTPNSVGRALLPVALNEERRAGVPVLQDTIEKEAFALLLELSDAEEPVDRLAIQIPALHQLVDAMLANRQTLAESLLGDQGELNKLTRKELAAKKAEFRKTAREQLSARLLEQAGILLLQKRVPNADGLVSWMRIEKAWLDVQLDQNLGQVEELCWQILGDAPPNVGQASDLSEESEHVENVLHESQARQQYLDALLKQRAFTMVLNLAARRKADPATIARVLKYIDAGIALRSPVAPRQESRTSNDANSKANAEGQTHVDAALGNRLAERGGYIWRNAKFRMFIALDRADDLERELREWIRTDVSTAPWRLMLARLVAERGKLDEAIQLFEACEKDKLLSASDYQMLADWYLVRNRRAAYERSRIEAFKQVPEHQLSNSLYQVRNRWSQSNVPLPSELDDETLFTFRALFEKSASPESYLWQLREIYAASRDFRLLQMIPHAVLGRSPQQVYSFLQSLQSQVLHELRNEASADEILKVVRELRDGTLARRASKGLKVDGVPNPSLARRASIANTSTPTDLRALDLLEALVERKSSELLNQPGPHVAVCVTALQRAFKRKWSDGEPRLMAIFLHQLGGLPHEAMKAEQLRELRELQQQTTPNSRDHVLITFDLCELMFWNYSQKEGALRETEAEVTTYTQANDGLWPHLDNEVLGRYVAMLEGAIQHAAGETVLQKHLAKPANDEQRKWLKDRLLMLFNNALEHDGAVSLGTGRTKQFAPLVAHILKELDAAPDEIVRHHLISRIVSTFDIAHRHKLTGTADAVRAFAFESLPVLLKRQQAQYRNTATTPLHVIGEVLGSKGALQYVVERIEQYPQRLEFGWENSWNTFSAELARRREEAAGAKLDIAELEPRVLKLAIRELKRELRTGDVRNYYIYRKHNSHFWPEKGPDFAKAAEEVLAENRTSGRRAVSVAQYLWSGLDRTARAIEILLLAHKNGLLDESAQVQLVNWLHQQNRWSESIPLLEPLVAARHDNINYRTLLMTAYHRSQRPEQLGDLVRQTHAHFHESSRWTESNIMQLAHGSAACELHDRAVGYFNEAIALHQRGNPGSGLGNAWLSNLYLGLADSHSVLGHTKEAVDAASGAIVCWGPHHNQRRHTFDKLNHVLASANDLVNYVERLDAEAAMTGQDSPILRKAIGQTFQSKNTFDMAIVQFQLALNLQPHDREVHQALIACYDTMKDAPAATKQLLKLIDLQRHDLALYQQLAERLKDNEAEAERAATSIIESAPNESESHAAMAELRQNQNRWPEAIPHWQRVAELRRLEPTGLLKLTEAQLHEKQWDAARQSIGKLQKTEWSSRFTDVTNQTRVLQERLPK